MWEIPNKSYETLYREALTADPPLKNIATDVSASPLWECGKCMKYISQLSFLGNQPLQEKFGIHTDRLIINLYSWHYIRCDSLVSFGMCIFHCLACHWCRNEFLEGRLKRCIWSWTTQIYASFILSQPTSRDLLTNPVWAMKMYFDHQKLLLCMV